MFDTNIAAHGVYEIICYDPSGEVKWRESFDNVVTTVGKNLALDTYLAGSAYTVTGPYMGLIDASGFTATAAADTMTSHTGWTEFTGYSGTRGTAAWSAASGGSKTLSASITFNINATGTVQGGFLVYGSGASTTISNTSGTLYSAGSFSTGSKSVSSGDTLSVTYTASL